MDRIDRKLKRLIDINIECDIYQLISFAFIEGSKCKFNDAEDIATWLMSDRTEFLLKDNVLYAHVVYEKEAELKAWEERRKQKEKMTIKTYLMKDLNTGLYKIGRSKNPAARERTLQSEKPTIKMVKVWDQDIEKDLHKQYESQRVRGEWFELSKVQVKYLTSNE